MATELSSLSGGLEETTLKTEYRSATIGLKTYKWASKLKEISLPLRALEAASESRLEKPTAAPHDAR